MLTPDGGATSDYSIVIFPKNKELWVAKSSERVRLTRPATDGSYDFQALPDGSYYLVALSDVEPADLADPEFLTRLMPGAIEISLAEGEQRRQDLRVLR